MTDHSDQSRAAISEHGLEDHYGPADTAVTSTIEMLRSSENALKDNDNFNDTSAQHIFQAINAEIIPRLMRAHMAPSYAIPENGATYAKICDVTVENLVSALTDKSVSAGHEIVHNALQEGVQLEHIYMHLLAPAARRIGELWDTDARDFSVVTIALCRLHELLRHHKLRPDPIAPSYGADCPSILLTTACQDQHFFGITMIAEFFRKDGWLVTCEPGASIDELTSIAKAKYFDVIGLSIARSVIPKDLLEEVSALRMNSNNQGVKIMLGGALIDRDPSISEYVGADSFSTDASEAPKAARWLLANMQKGCC